MGYIKKELAYMGDVLNTSARLEGECKNYNSDFIVSGEVIDRVKLPYGLFYIDLGKIKLRGKEEETRLYSVSGKLN